MFTNRGAKLKSWTLKAFHDLQKRPQELVPSYLEPGRVRPFDLMVDDANATARLKDALFHVWPARTAWTRRAAHRQSSSTSRTASA